jgi:Cu/Zn superoxide dismutase
MGKLARILMAMLLVMLAACGGGEDEQAKDEPTGAPTIKESPTAAAASVKFVVPADGAKVTSPVKVQMEATGVAIEPAADGVKPNSGHFHIVVDADCVAAGQVVPADLTHIHYGKAQKEAELPLTPGEHTLCLQVADAAHTATDLTKKITITVGS